DPFTTGLHEVLCAINQLNDPILIDYRDIASTQPALGELCIGLAIGIVRSCNPRATHLQFTEGLVIPWHLLPCLHVDHTKLYAGYHCPLPSLDIELLLKGQVLLVTA